jgi:hypothetical protein
MTPLERAKAFIQSRAAKTALKILPLALATATVAAPPAHAGNVVINPTYATFDGCVIGQPPGNNCSGSFVLGSQTTSFSATSTLGNVTGASGSGTGHGYFNGDLSQESWNFNVGGDGTGSTTSFNALGLDTANVSWTFSFPVDRDVQIGDGAGNGITMQYYLTDGSNVDFNTCAVSLDTNTNSATGSCVINGLSQLGPLTAWSLDLNTPILSTANGAGTLQWDVTSLNIFGTQIIGAPEPASLTLLVAAVPFLLRKRR